MNKNTLLAIGWPATVVGAFVIGNISDTSRITSDSDKKSDKIVRTTKQRNSSTSNVPLRSELSLEKTKERVMTVAKVSTTEFEDDFGIKKIIMLDDPIKRASLLLSVMNNMKSNDFLKVVANFRSLKITSQRTAEYKHLLHAWAKVDPNAALAYSQKNKKNNTAEKIILASWVKHEPSAAIEWAESNYEGDGVNPYFTSLIEGLATTDIDLATEMFEALPSSQEQFQALSSLVNQISTESNDTALAWLDTITNEKLKKRAHLNLLGELAKKDPASIAEWALEIADQSTRNQSLKTIASHWSKDNLTEAKTWVSSLEPDQQINAAQGMISELIEEDPLTAADWIEPMKNHEDFQSLLRSYTQAAAVNHPEAALAQIPNMDNSRSQAISYKSTLENWARDNPEATSKWLEQNEVPEDVKKNITQFVDKVNNGERVTTYMQVPNYIRGSNSVNH